MVVNEIWFDMKDGRKALIRSPREEDIPGMLDYLLLFCSRRVKPSLFCDIRKNAENIPMKGKKRCLNG